MDIESKKIMLDLRIEESKLSVLLEYILREHTPTNRSEFGRLLINILYAILKRNGLLNEAVPKDFYEKYWTKGMRVPDVQVNFEDLKVDEEEQSKLLDILKGKQ